LGVGRGSGSAALRDGGDDGIDSNRLTLFHLNLRERSGHGRGNLGVDLVGRDLEERLVALDGIARLLEPLGDGAFGDGFAHLGHNYVSRHEDSLSCYLALVIWTRNFGL